jgi:CheY-like chemotaxis protein
LADTIKKSGSTLNETLTSVLSYAKINQFERQQHKYRQRRPPDTKWSLPDKVLASGPDTDFEGLYMCTNVAMLCEEVAGVLEAGKSYDNPENNRGVNVVLNIDYGENWNFYTEPGALRRTAINIIGNALKYTTEGSVTITLTASEIDTGDVPLAGDKTTRRRIVTLSVKDTGKGMSKEFIHKHLFVPFTQEDVTSSDGVGLGMSIVKSLVSLLAGEIRVESQQGVGTEVTVTMPMRQVDPDRSDPGKPALELEQSIEALRREHLSAVLFGFPDVIRRGLENYLREWFHCNILEAVDDAKPDVVLVDEGNEAVAKDVERTAERYGRLGILLSIATAPENLSKPMVPIQGYRMFERVRRPIGPYSLAKALSACVEKLRSRSHRQQEEQEHKGHSPEIHDQEEGLQPGNRDPAKEDSSNTTKSQVAQPPGEEDTAQASTRASIERPPPTRSSSSFSIATHYVDEADPSTLRILVVEDNIVNRRLLGAFLKRYGCKNLTNAENGAVAVKEVEACTRNFDVILMGKLTMFMLFRLC